MNHLFVPYEIAKKLKEKGYDELCLCYYDLNSKALQITKCTGGLYYRNSEIGILGANITSPIHQQVTDWLREKHKMCIVVMRNYDGWCYGIIDFKHGNKHLEINGENLEIETFYEALTTAIEHALKLI